MILVLAGTKDGRDIAQRLSMRGYEVLVSVTSSYGRQLISAQGLNVSAAVLDEKGIYDLIGAQGITCVIDATHPYAVNASINAMNACKALNVKYIRYERPVSKLPEYAKLHTVFSHEEAAKKAVTLGKTIFLTTGSRSLKIYAQKLALKSNKIRIIARVLPDENVIKECINLGFTPRDIIAMQGPFSHELNAAMFRDTNTDVVITKNSGQVGGSDTKFSAAIELGLHIVVVDRPPVAYEKIAYCPEEIEEKLIGG